MKYEMNTLLFVILAALGMLALPQSVNAASNGAATRVPTELWVGGDDGLTQKFADSLRKAIGRSKDFSASSSKTDDALLLTIPSHIYWRPVKKRTNFQYVVIFTDRNSKYLGVSIGNCWEDSMDGCSLRVLTQAKLAWPGRR